MLAMLLSSLLQWAILAVFVIAAVGILVISSSEEKETSD
jgi:uncharacterized membrane protein